MEAEFAAFSAAPGTLISVPQLKDPNFNRSVVLMLVHNQEGAVGMVINHQMTIACSEVAERFELPWSGDPEQRVLRGGPVDPEGLWILHKDEHSFEESLEAAPGVLSSRSRKALDTLLQQQVSPLAFGLGIAGWGPGQLEEEIAEGAWVHGRTSSELIFEWPRDKVWSLALKELGIDPAMLMVGGGMQ